MVNDFIGVYTYIYMLSTVKDIKTNFKYCSINGHSLFGFYLKSVFLLSNPTLPLKQPQVWIEDISCIYQGSILPL